MSKNGRKNLILMAAGVFGMGVFLSLLLKAGYGTDTSSFMNSSIASRLDLPLGPVMVCVNALLFIVQLIWGRSLIGIGTVANMTLIGFTSDFCAGIWQTYLPDHIFLAQPERIIIFIIALAGFLISAALYMNSESGLAPYDAIPVMLSSAMHLPFHAVRTAWDFLAIAAGLAAGGRLTAGTFIMALTLGSAVSFTGRILKAGKSEIS